VVTVKVDIVIVDVEVVVTMAVTAPDVTSSVIVVVS
jgi:hypothetical protein